MLGIYIHIPFCKQKCKYCDFNSYSGIRSMSSSYANALIDEINKSELRGKAADTVYIGGGTPTFIAAEYTEQVMRAINEDFAINPDAEITIECNPGTADFEKLSRLRDCGINRISIGCQSADDGILKTLGRIHTYAEFEECYFTARKAGFDNISVDLMFGLPGQSLKIWRDTLDRVISLEPEHISVYSLKIEEGTPFFDMLKDGVLNIPDDDANREMYDTAVEILNDNGYNRYEISNFAKTGHESRHNLLYWQCDDYIGFGAGACSCIGGKRFSNEYDINDYISKIGESGSAVIKSEAAAGSPADLMSEFMFLGLRLDRGVSKSEFAKRFNKDVYEVFGEQLRRHTDVTRTLIDDGKSIRIKPEYTYVSNIIMSDFV